MAVIGSADSGVVDQAGSRSSTAKASSAAIRVQASAASPPAAHGR
jgi:hypothetical protein